MDADGDNVVVSSSSESEDEVDEDYQQTAGNSAAELTLQDDEKDCLLVQPPDEDLGEGEQEADYAAQYEEEGEGDGIEDIITEAMVESADKKDAEKKKKKKKKKKFLYICLTNCKYDVVRRTSRKFGFKEVSDDEEWSLYWTDFSVALERVMDMKKYQKINHFPGMNEICRKDLLARNMNRMLKMFPKEYSIFPKTWVLPADYGDFQAYTRQKKNKTYILKPESGCQGRGIWITKNPKDVKPHEHMICQVYTNRPYLIDGFKFDLRIYTLVTSCDPLRIFVFKDGLARFATNKYCEPTNSNTENVYMHLTNYAINKNSEDFVRDDEAGSKRRISTINKYLVNKGVDINKMWNDIDDAIIKTIISAHSVLKHNYRTCFPNHVKGSACFEILGFDILLDRRLRPYVLEVNHSPSFTTDAPIDREIKGALIWDTLGLVNFAAVDRRRCLEEERKRIKDRLLGKSAKKETKEELEVAQQQYLEQLERYEDSHLGNFRRILPVPGCEKYDKYFHSSGTLFQETAAFRARTELARQQREEIIRKKEKMDSMLKKGKRSDSSGMRPESPVGRRKRISWHRNTALHLKPRQTQRAPEENRNMGDEVVDTLLPMEILEEEELERISGLLQRDNLVRGLGIVEHVYRLLHCTPGTMGMIRSDPKPQPLPLVRPKDRQYYKKLLDRYFGANHALSHDGDTNSATIIPSGNGSLFRQKTLSETGANRTWNATASTAGIGSGTSGGGDESGSGVVGGGGGVKGPRATLQQCPQVKLAFTSNNNNNVASLAPSAGQQPVSDFGFCETDEEPGASGGLHWPIKSKSLGNISERSMASYQRSKLTRKSLAGPGIGVGGRANVVVQESDIRSMTGLIDTEAERNRLLARSGYYQNPSYATAQITAPSVYYQPDWRSDTSTPARTRILSAHRQGRQDAESLGVTRYLPQHPSHGLSVVSAPAPVIHRQDILSPGSGNSRQAPVGAVAGNGVEIAPTSRLTKSQRVRGASNSVRLKQIEMRENHAFVYS